MRTDDERRVPLPSTESSAAASAALSAAAASGLSTRLLCLFCGLRHRAADGVARVGSDRRVLSGSQIESLQRTLLRLGIDDVWILGVYARLKTIAATDTNPVARPNAGAIECP